jgi:hypothetical protein
MENPSGMLILHYTTEKGRMQQKKRPPAEGDPHADGRFMKD